LVVSLTITGIAMTAGVGIVAAVADRRLAITTATAAVARAAAQRDAIVQWIAGARLSAGEGGPQFGGLDGVHGHTPDDQVSFLTTAATPLGTGETIARLYVDRDTLTPERGLTATFTAWRGLGAARLELDPNVAGMDVQYLTAIVGSGGWMPSWISSTLVPVAVAVQLLPAVGDTLPPLLRLPILVPIRGGR